MSSSSLGLAFLRNAVVPSTEMVFFKCRGNTGSFGVLSSSSVYLCFPPFHEHIYNTLSALLRFLSVLDHLHCELRLRWITSSLKHNLQQLVRVESHWPGVRFVAPVISPGNEESPEYKFSRTLLVQIPIFRPKVLSLKINTFLPSQWMTIVMTPQHIPTGTSWQTFPDFLMALRTGQNDMCNMLH